MKPERQVLEKDNIISILTKQLIINSNINHQVFPVNKDNVRHNCRSFGESNNNFNNRINDSCNNYVPLEQDNEKVLRNMKMSLPSRI